MSLIFPNRSRSYDETAKRIRFVGYDGTFEIRFFVETNAFATTTAAAASPEAGYLAAFDEARSSVYEAARKAYSHGRRNMYVLTALDFQ